MNDAIGYLRVSTREQGRSGLGLAAPRHDIETFASREGFAIKSWYQDIAASIRRHRSRADGETAGILIATQVSART
jgi:DNA invertase Pin-like site-specific DNA recombinase